MPFRYLIVAFLSLAAIRVVAEEPSVATEQRRSTLEGPAVSRLIDRLGSPTRRDRAQAEEALLAAGYEILPLLPGDEFVAEPAVTTALKRIRAQLEKEAAEAAPRPSRITAAGRHSLSELAAMLTKATGNPVTVDSAMTDQSLEVAWAKTDIWTAVRDVERRAEVVTQADPAQESLVWSDRPKEWTATPSITSGPFRIDIVSVASKPNLTAPGHQLIQIRWKMTPEPRLRPLYAIVADADMALAVKDMAAAPFSPDAKLELPMDRWAGCELDSSFDVDGGKPPKELRFSGATTVKVASLPMPLSFDDLTGKTTLAHRRGGVSAVVRNVNFDQVGQSLRLQLAVAYDRGGPEFESHRNWVFQNAARLERKADGEPIKADGADLIQIGRTGGTIEYEFTNLTGSAADYRFVYEAPLLVVDVPVTFEDVSLSLP